ncbi:dUTP diphosphatase [Enterorhabdus sp. P55]|uniref:dUTP diphosphatase n=1 Tax=Enterorhabdus sp. P55 TaxID=2304571 RepID=UPI00136A73E5|nr:dUTP diphosphatase [Enterorhabdus sp. P55]NBI32024.1 dUTP diphosphatase [Enterorhabdus sp. P55]
MPLPLPIQMFDFSNKLPSYAHEGDAGLDLRAAEALTLGPLERAVVSCGFAMAIPQGYAGLVIPRSGLAAQRGITVVNAPGLIDSGYRGEVKVVLMNLDLKEPFEIHVGDRIAQLMIVAAPAVMPVAVESLDDTQRGSGGFGSSGVSS